MSLTRTLLSDRTGLLGAGSGLLAGLPPWAIYLYLLLRVIIPIFLIVVATRGATPAQKIGLVRAYLLGPAGDGTERTGGSAEGSSSCCDPAQSGPDPSLEP